MVWINNFFFLLGLNAITGNIAFGISLALIPLAMRCGCIKLIYNMLKGVVFFFIVPIAYVIAQLIMEHDLVRDSTGYDGNTAITMHMHVVFMIWLAGAVIAAIRLARKNAPVLTLRSYNIPVDDPVIRDIFYGTYPIIAKKQIPIYQNLMIGTPMIVGVFHPALLVPETSYSESELKIILQHEATHVVHHDNFWKCIGCIVASIIWWNPLLYPFLKEWTKWVETYCDISVCNRFLDGERKTYAGILLKYSTGIDIRVPSTHSSPLGDKDSIAGRIKRLSKIKKGKRYAALGLVLSAVFVAGTSMTALAAGNTAANVAEGIYWNTLDDNLSGEDFEYVNLDNVDNETVFELKAGEWNPEDFTVIDMEASDETALLETVKHFDWNVPAMSFGTSANFLKTKGSVIQGSCYITASSSVKFGVIGPDGAFTYTPGKGQVGIKYTVKRFGYHKVAVQNITNKQINASGYYVK